MPSELIGVPELEQQLRRLEGESPRTIRSALARLAFLVRDDIGAHVGRSLDWSGPATQRFIAGGFRVSYSMAEGTFGAVIYPAPRAAALLARHVQPYTVTTRDRADLMVNGKLAIPVPGFVPRTRSGRVPDRLLPRALLARDARGRSRGFISRDGATIMYRQVDGNAVPAYALLSQTAQPQRLHVAEVAKRSAAARAPAAIADALERAARSAGIRGQ